MVTQGPRDDGIKTKAVCSSRFTSLFPPLRTHVDLPGPAAERSVILARLRTDARSFCAVRRRPRDYRQRRYAAMLATVRDGAASRSSLGTETGRLAKTVWPENVLVLGCAQKNFRFEDFARTFHPSCAQLWVEEPIQRLPRRTACSLRIGRLPKNDRLTAGCSGCAL